MTNSRLLLKDKFCMYSDSGIFSDRKRKSQLFESHIFYVHILKSRNDESQINPVYKINALTSYVAVLRRIATTKYRATFWQKRHKIRRHRSFKSPENYSWHNVVLMLFNLDFAVTRISWFILVPMR